MNKSNIFSILELLKNTKSKNISDPIIVNSTILFDLFSQLDSAIVLKFKDQIFDNIENLSPKHSGCLLKSIRVSIGISQSKASELSGISQGNISTIENGSKKVVKGKVVAIGSKQRKKLVETYRTLAA